MFKDKRARYLLAGSWNTVFGYCIGVLFYYLLHNLFHTLVIIVLANILNISMSFLTYKIFVFKTRGNWVFEYIRCYVVYGNIALIGMLLIWALVDFFMVPFWIAQALVLVVSVTLSYVAHARFTFKKMLINKSRE